MRLGSLLALAGVLAVAGCGAGHLEREFPSATLEPDGSLSEIDLARSESAAMLTRARERLNVRARLRKADARDATGFDIGGDAGFLRLVWQGDGVVVIYALPAEDRGKREAPLRVVCSAMRRPSDTGSHDYALALQPLAGGRVALHAALDGQTLIDGCSAAFDAEAAPLQVMLTATSSGDRLETFSMAPRLT